MEGMEKQLTAVEWLVEKHVNQCGVLLLKDIEQAKEMENKQRHFAYQDGREDVFDWLKKMDYDFLVEEINKTE
jgi:hypothetical protein